MKTLLTKFRGITSRRIMNMFIRHSGRNTNTEYKKVQYHQKKPTVPDRQDETEQILI